jgi:hypothetical protein
MADVIVELNLTAVLDVSEFASNDELIAALRTDLKQRKVGAHKGHQAARRSHDRSRAPPRARDAHTEAGTNFTVTFPAEK